MKRQKNKTTGPAVESIPIVLSSQTPEGFVNPFYQFFWEKSRQEDIIMENKKTLTEQIERLLARASEEQLRILYVAALYLV